MTISLPLIIFLSVFIQEIYRIKRKKSSTKLSTQLFNKTNSFYVKGGLSSPCVFKSNVFDDTDGVFAFFQMPIKT